MVTLSAKHGGRHIERDEVLTESVPILYAPGTRDSAARGELHPVGLGGEEVVAR